VWWGERDPGTRMTEHDRLLLQALTSYEADLCACGHPRDEAWSPDNDPANHEHVAHYETGPPYRCFACTVLAKSQSNYAKAYGDDHMRGAYWVAELIPRGKTIQT